MNTTPFSGYFADPFVISLADGTYVAFGGSGAPAVGERVFESLASDDLVSWRPHGPVLKRLAPSFGDEYWAPEVVEEGGRFWLFYSVGHGIVGHHLRVAMADSALGPFEDQDVNLTPRERFAIDPHPFLDVTGQWYLFFARDVLEDERPGTHLAVMPLENMTSASAGPFAVLTPNADWQIYERGRQMYGGVFDWYTLEGPSVVRRHGKYWLTFSGGAWTGPGYAVSWASADAPTGPWTHAPAGTPPLLFTSKSLIGPGHNSFVVSPSGDDIIVFHAWDEELTVRRMHLHPVAFQPDGPRVDGPTRGPSELIQNRFGNEMHNGYLPNDA